jgi:hypothetical protein
MQVNFFGGTILGLAVVTAALAADNPFVGTWKLDVSKSDWHKDQITYSDAGGGEIKYVFGAQSYKFKTDGKERPGLLGEMATWTKLDDHTWQAMYKTKGILTDTNTIKVSEDGMKLSEEDTGKRQDGTTFNESYEYAREGQGKGLMGTWKFVSAKVPDPEPMTIKDFENGAGLTFYIPASKVEYSGKFDEKPFKVSGPTIPEGASGSMYKSKPLLKGVFTVSDDGKTLTLEGTPVGAATFKSVMVRQ